MERNNYETYNLVVLECEELLFQAITMLFRIFSLQESFDFVVTENELISVTPYAIFRIG